MNPKLDIALFLLFGTLETVFSSDWSYTGSNGPENWKNLQGYSACGGQKQSPIDIATSKAEYRESLGLFSYTGYNTNPSSMTLVNNGHTAQVNLEGNIRVSGGGLPGEYIAAQFHFHWGGSNTQGSEHTINNKQFPMEVHIVHYSSRFGSLGEAADKAEGLAVLGFMFEVGGNDNPALATLVSGLSSIENKGTEASIDAFTLDSFLPTSREDYFRYSGSLTTPGCFESVVWTVFNDKIKMSQKQLDAFRALRGSSGNIVDNFRPVQPLFSRQVLSSMENGADRAAAAHSVLVLVTAAVLTLISI